MRVSDLGRQALFTHEGTPNDVKRLRQLLSAERAPMPEIQLVPLTEAIVELVKADLGIGLMSRWAVAPYEASGQIVPVASRGRASKKVGRPPTSETPPICRWHDWPSFFASARRHARGGIRATPARAATGRRGATLEAATPAPRRSRRTFDRDRAAAPSTARS